MSRAVVYLEIETEGEVDRDLLDDMLEESRHWGDFSCIVLEIIPLVDYDS